MKIKAVKVKEKACLFSMYRSQIGLWLEIKHFLIDIVLLDVVYGS